MCQKKYGESVVRAAFAGQAAGTDAGTKHCHYSGCAILLSHIAAAEALV